MAIDLNKTCRYCLFCSKIGPGMKDGVFHTPQIPPSLVEYECLRTHKKLGREGDLYSRPEWCPIDKTK